MNADLTARDEHGRTWATEVVLIPRYGWRVSVECNGHTQGCWGDFPTERKAERYGKAQIRRLIPLVPPGSEVRHGGMA